MRNGYRRVLLLAAALGSTGVGLAQRSAPATIDCTLEGKPLTCSRAELLKRFAEAHTITLNSEPKSRVSEAQLANFAKSLGKQAVPEMPADLTLHLVRTPPAGVTIGPGDVDLATLRVFSSKHGAEESHLIWVETYRGQADLPWPAIVRGVTDQLQATLAGK